MLSIDQAKLAVGAQPRVSLVKDAILYRNAIYIVRVVFVDANEAEWDPFYSVDKDTGEVKEFSFLYDGDPGEITTLFLGIQDTEGGSL
jgi:hypothetical protein